MFSLSSKIYLDTYEKTYYRILCVNKPPPGPLSNYIVRVKHNRLSPFESFTEPTNCCIYAIKHIPTQCHSYNCTKHRTYMTIDDIDVLLDFLVNNNYSVNNSFTKVIQKNNRLNKNDDFICYFSYNP
jgi:hypothetical protein